MVHVAIGPLALQEFSPVGVLEEFVPVPQQNAPRGVTWDQTTIKSAERRYLGHDFGQGLGFF